MDIQKLSKKELIEVFYQYYDSVEVLQCYSVKDLFIYEALAREIERREYKLVQKMEVV